MTAIRLQSFRSLGDTDFVEFRPLTILVGRNSSGKSSFLRFLPLLRQSLETRTTGPIQWYGDYVDFGGFEETHSTFSADDEMRFGFRTTLGDRPRPSSFVHFDPFDFDSLLEALAFSRQPVVLDQLLVGRSPEEIAAGSAGDDFEAAFGGSGSEDPRTQRRPGAGPPETHREDLRRAEFAPATSSELGVCSAASSR